MVFAMTNKAQGTKGISALIVEKSWDGFTFGKQEHKMGLHFSATRELIFQDVRVPVDNLLGSAGEDGGRIGVAAQAVGIAQAALKTAQRYARKRVQFGKAIAAFRGMSFMLADRATRMETVPLLTYRAADLKDRGQPYSKEAAMTKLFASDTW